MPPGRVNATGRVPPARGVSRMSAGSLPEVMGNLLCAGSGVTGTSPRAGVPNQPRYPG